MAVVALLVLVTACGGDGSTGSSRSDTAEAASGDAEPGGRLVFHNASGPPSLDPTRHALGATYGSVGVVFYALFGGLVVQTEDSLVEPSLLESLESSDQGATWTLKLRPDLVFTDGTPLDAAAITDNWDRIKDPANGSSSLGSFTAEVASYRVVDALTVEATLTSTNTTFPHFLALNGANFIGSPTQYRAVGADFGTNPVGAGPFMLESGGWSPDTPVEMEKNPDYWDTPRPYLDEFVYMPMSDRTQALNLARSGQIDVLWASSDQALVQQCEAAGLVIEESVSVQGTGMLINASEPPMDDPAVREAIANALDYELIWTTIFGRELPLPDSVIPDASAFATDDLPFPHRDLDHAQELIDEYLQRTGEDSIEISYEHFAGITAQEDLAQVVQASLQELDGVTVTLIATPPEVMSTRIPGESPTTHAGAGWVGFWPTVDGVYSSDSEANVGGYDDPMVDEAIERARTATDHDEQIAAYQDVLRRIYLENFWYIPWTQGSFSYCDQPDVRNHVSFNGAGLLPDQVWIDS